MAFSDFISSAGGAGAFSAAGSLASGILGNIAQSNANKTNLQIARETNQANKDIAALNNQLQMDLWREQRDWNSYANQRALLEAAGYNPNSLFDGNGVVGTSSAAPPQLQQATMSPASVMPVDSFSRSVGDLMTQTAGVVASLASAKKMVQEAKGVEIDNETRGSLNWSRIRHTNSQADYTDRLSDMIDKTQDSQVKLLEEQAKQAQIKTVVDGLRKDLDIKYFDKERSVALSKALQEISTNLSNEKYYDAQVAFLKYQERIGWKQYELDKFRASLEQIQVSSLVRLQESVQNMNVEQTNLIREQIVDKQIANGVAAMGYDALKNTNFLEKDYRLKLRSAFQSLQKGKLDMEQTKAIAHYFTQYADYIDAQKYGQYLDMTLRVLKSPFEVTKAAGDAAGSVVSALPLIPLPE